MIKIDRLCKYGEETLSAGEDSTNAHYILLRTVGKQNQQQKKLQSHQLTVAADAKAERKIGDLGRYLKSKTDQSRRPYGDRI
jgi:UDP-glucose 6-dehydrogenase